MHGYNQLDKHCLRYYKYTEELALWVPHFRRGLTLLFKAQFLIGEALSNWTLTWEEASRILVSSAASPQSRAREERSPHLFPPKLKI